MVGVYPGSGIDDGGEIIRIFGSGFLMPTWSALHNLIHTGTGKYPAPECCSLQMNDRVSPYS